MSCTLQYLNLSRASIIPCHHFYLPIGSGPNRSGLMPMWGGLQDWMRIIQLDGIYNLIFIDTELREKGTSTGFSIG